MRFKQKVALVIGGNSGIGLEATKGLAAEGAYVFITGRSRETLVAAESAIPGVRAFQADMSDITSLDAVLADIGKSHDRIDILLINAGVGGFAPIREVTPEFWDQVHDVNARGAFFALQKALPMMGRGGSVVYTGSIGSVMGIPGNAVYAAAKAGLRAMVRCAAAELVADGIRVNVVSPGPTETPIMNRNPGMDEADVEVLRARMCEAVPMKRMGEPDEIAKAILFLASDDASFITGIDLYADGGSVELM